MTASDAVMGRFSMWLEAKTLAPATVLNYCSQAGQWLAWCSSQDVDFTEANRDDITTCLGELRQQNALPNTLKNRLIAIRIFLDFCLDAGYRTDNPAREIKIRRPESRTTQSFSQREIRRMYDACKDFR